MENIIIKTDGYYFVSLVGKEVGPFSSATEAALNLIADRK